MLARLGNCNPKITDTKAGEMPVPAPKSDPVSKKKATVIVVAD